MAAGESKFSSRGVAIKRFENTPIPKGTYEFELLSDGMEVKVSLENPENSIPRIGCRFAAHGTAKEEGGKNRLYFHDFFLSTKPGKDSTMMPARGGQLIEFARAQGDELDDIDLEEKTITNADGQEETVKYLSPGQVMEYLESKVGGMLEGKLNIEPDSAQADDPTTGLKRGDKFPLSEAHPGRNKMSNWQLDASMLAGSQEEEEAPAKSLKATGTQGTQGKGAKVTTLPTKGKKR